MMSIQALTFTHQQPLRYFRQQYAQLLLWCTGLAAAMLMCASSFAANPQSWWTDIANNRADSVKQALARGADPNELSPNGQPAIMQAIRDGAWDVYDVLAAHPKTVRNAININKETPLMYLAVTGQTKRAQDLINRGALVNRLGWTPLQYAASKGHLDTVKMLVANKAIVNSPGPDGTTALMMAAYGGSEDVVRYLLSVGADVTMKTTQQYDAAYWARLKNHTSLADKLDELSARVLAKQQGSTASEATVDLTASQAAPAAETQAESVPDSQPDNESTSRYFDLDRFNEEPSP